PDRARQRDHDEGVAAVVVLEVRQVADRRALRAVAVDDEAVEALLTYEAAHLLDALLVLLDREGEMEPRLALLPRIADPTPPVRPLHLAHDVVPLFSVVSEPSDAGRTTGPTGNLYRTGGPSNAPPGVPGAGQGSSLRRAVNQRRHDVGRGPLWPRSGALHSFV